MSNTRKQQELLNYNPSGPTDPALRARHVHDGCYVCDEREDALAAAEAAPPWWVVNRTLAAAEAAPLDAPTGRHSYSEHEGDCIVCGERFRAALPSPDTETER